MDQAAPARTGAPISVVIPAHDEAAVIGRCLTAMLADAQPGELDVVVACNGCTDDTAAIARSLGARVVEIAQPSKHLALDAGDRVAIGFPRFFVDADIEVGTEAIRTVAEVLRHGDALAAAPRLALDLSGLPWAVRAYYRLWQELPYVRAGMVGSGVYAVSEEGRARFDHFPDLIADDYFVRNLFAAHERVAVDGATFTSRPPRTLSATIRRKVRVYTGNRQWVARHGAPPAGDASASGGIATVVRRRPDLAVGLPVYLLVAVVAKFRAARNVRRADFSTWGRDETTRQLAA